MTTVPRRKLLYPVRLTPRERETLRALVRTGHHSSRMIARARILLEADDGCSDVEIAEACGVDRSTVVRVRRRFAQEGRDAALQERQRTGAPRKLSLPEEVVLAATACTQPPRGYARWTLTLLADRFVRLTGIAIGRDTVRRRLAEVDLKPWQHKMWCIPTVDQEFRIRMEDVISLYVRSAAVDTPVVCFDETPVQLLDHVRVPVLARPGVPWGQRGRRHRFDYEYRRRGTANVFMMIDAQRGWRRVKVTRRRAAEDFATCMRELVDRHYPRARRIRVVLDNLSTHTKTSLIRTFGQREARRIMARIEFHYTPKHASWLNMAEIEIGVMKRQCLARRIPDVSTLRAEVVPWSKRRNRSRATIRWMFGLEKARARFGDWRAIASGQSRIAA